MNETTYLPQDELVQRGIEALMNALGPVETMRFLNLPRLERLGFIKRHRKWQDSLDQQQFFNQVFGAENQ